MTATLGNHLVLFPLNLNVSLEETHMFAHLINRDKTHVVEWVLTTHCTKSLMQCLFVLPLQFSLIKYWSEISEVILLAERQKRLVKYCYLQIELLPNIKISMIKNSFRKSGSFIPHSRVQSNFVWSRPPLLKSLV